MSSRGGARSLPFEQQSLFGQEAPQIDASFGAIEHLDLAYGAWIELARGWLTGHVQLFERLLRDSEWKSERRLMYENEVDVPRQYASVAEGSIPILEEMRAALEARYASPFPRLSLALYRDGRDSVAWHGDYVARRLPEALVATVSVGAPRRFFLRPTGGGRSMSFSLGWGDLLVMGGSCQRTYQHCVPKVAHADPRIAIMYRPIWEEKR